MQIMDPRAEGLPEEDLKIDLRSPFVEGTRVVSNQKMLENIFGAPLQYFSWENSL